jgi:very-short-patch-repair endonuclease/predicted transcriptional regulator of viral defense system
LCLWNEGETAEPPTASCGSHARRRSGFDSTALAVLMAARPSMEAVMNNLAKRQHGVITRAQLLDAGLTSRMVSLRIEQQRLQRIHRGVYVMGPVMAPFAREMAAVLACGSGAVLSHRSSAALRELIRPTSASAPVDVTVLGRTAAHRPGIRARSTLRFDPGETIHWSGIPMTTPARTLVDLAADLGRTGMSRELEQAVSQALRRALTTAAELLSLIARHPRRHGIRLLRALVEDGTAPVLTRSEAEELLLALVRRARLPTPTVNVPIGGHEVDFGWTAERLVVEVDGHAYHSARSRFESDRRRDADLAAAGFRVIRVTWHQLTRESQVVLARIAMALGRGAEEQSRLPVGLPPGRGRTSAG